MIQPNFLDLDWRVRQALELATLNPEATSSKTYAEPLQKALVAFHATMDNTDHTYTQWRTTRGEQMTAFRDLRRDSDRARALCDEHAIDDYPSQRIVYTDEEELLSFVNDAVAFLSAHIDEWDWVQKQISVLKTGVEGAGKLKKKEQARYRAYVQRAQDRVRAYDTLYAMFRDYLRDAGNDLSAQPIYREIRLDYV